MLSNASFAAVTDLFHRVSGIRLSEAKRPLVAGRLQKLAARHGCASLDDYVEHLMHADDPEEVVRVIDKLTTNETYFFREPQHFDALAALLDERPQTPHRAHTAFRVWSAASSSGEEAYSIAMLLADRLGLDGWDVVGTDLSTSMVEQARRGLYPMERARDMPADYLKRWCRKGHGAHDGQLLVSQDLRRRVRFEGANLTQPLPNLGLFDVIFLRNVLIYFDTPGKADIVRRVLPLLKPQGRLFTGHAESIANLNLPVRSLAPAVYVRTADALSGATA
jgi:chemotaxis protein methyltransferase CheR